MRTRALVALAVLALSAFAACGDDDDDNGGETPAPATETATATAPGSPAGGATATVPGTQAPDREQDRLQIRDLLQRYIDDAREQDRERLREHVAPGVDDPALDRARDQVRDRLYQFVEVVDVAFDGERTTVTVLLRDKDGAEVPRTLELERDQDQWRIRDPDLHE